MGEMREEQYPPEWMEKVKKLGRVFIYNQVMWLSWSGTGIEFECEGGFELRLKADEIPFDREDADVHMARYAIFCDGQTPTSHSQLSPQSAEAATRG